MKLRILSLCLALLVMIGLGTAAASGLRFIRMNRPKMSVRRELNNISKRPHRRLRDSRGREWALINHIVGERYDWSQFPLNLLFLPEAFEPIHALDLFEKEGDHWVSRVTNFRSVYEIGAPFSDLRQGSDGSLYFIMVNKLGGSASLVRIDPEMKPWIMALPDPPNQDIYYQAIGLEVLPQDRFIFFYNMDKFLFSRVIQDGELTPPCARQVLLHSMEIMITRLQDQDLLISWWPDEIYSLKLPRPSGTLKIPIDQIDECPTLPRFSPLGTAQ